MASGDCSLVTDIYQHVTLIFNKAEPQKNHIKRLITSDYIPSHKYSHTPLLLNKAVTSPQTDSLVADNRRHLKFCK